MIASKRITLYQSEGMKIDLEYTEHYAILHLPLLKMNKTNYLEFLEKVPELCQFLMTTGYAGVWTAIEPEKTVVAKLLDRLGAKRLGSDSGLDVYEICREEI